MIKIKTPDQVKIMQEGGKIASEALQEAIKAVNVGVPLSEIDKVVEDYILIKGAVASFKTVDDYDNATCININEGIVHGIPNKYKIKKGDVVSIDLGVYFKGFHTDLSYTLEVGSNKEQNFLDLGKLALDKAIKQCVIGNKLGDVSSTIQSEVESHGYSVSHDLVGHGIGEKLHEDPYVPCYGKSNSGPELKEGMVFAVEVIYQKGKPDLALDSDGWTLVTADSSVSGLFEKTVAVSKEGPVLITNFD